jgi:hypothetical protein
MLFWDAAMEVKKINSGKLRARAAMPASSCRRFNLTLPQMLGAA